MRALLLLPALVLGLLAVTAPAAEAATVRLNSLNSYQTFSFGSTVRQRLLWDKDKQMLYGLIEFTNQPYVLRGEYVQRETALFFFRGVKYDEAQKLFYVNSGGTRIPVAHLRNQIINTEVQPAKGTQVIVNKSASGKVRLTIVASTTPRSGDAWVER